MNKIEFDRDSYIEMKQVYTNLKNYDFECLGNYKMTENESKKFVKAFEKFFNEERG